jgi:hypothetical protein
LSWIRPDFIWRCTTALIRAPDGLTDQASSFASAEEHKQCDYDQDGFRIITTSPGWNELDDIGIFGKFYARRVGKRRRFIFANI